MPAREQPDPRYELIFREAVRAIEHQATRRDDVRARAGMLITASSVATAFLGGAALKSHHHGGAAAWVAIALFGVITVGSTWILAPRPNWNFVNSAGSMLVNYVGTDPVGINDMLADLSLHLEHDYERNAVGLDHYTRALQGLSLVLLFEVGMWVIALVQGR